jgi:hypothetical protein
MPRKINRAITMAESRWRLQVFRADGFIDREQLFTNEDQAFRAFDALAPSIPKRLQVRYAGKARYITVDYEGRHAFKPSPHFSDCCEACGEAETHETHGAP